MLDQRAWADVVELLEYRSQRLKRDDQSQQEKSPNPALYETEQADRVTYVNNPSAFGIGIKPVDR